MTTTFLMRSSRDQRWGFGLALAAHAALFMIGSLAWQQRAQYGMDASIGAVDVELVAAPAVASPQVISVTPPMPVIVPDASDVIQPVRMPKPAPAVTPTPTPLTPPLPAPSAVGDGNSLVPGTDATTLHRKEGSETMAKPGYQRNPPPPYPLEARRLKQEGRVLLNISVTAEGRVDAIQLKQSSGFPLLDDAALKGVQNWRFRPATVGGLRIASDVEVPIRFQLK